MDNDSLLRLTFRVPVREFDKAEFSKSALVFDDDNHDTNYVTVIEVGKYATGNVVFPDGTEEDLHLVIELNSFRKLEVLS
jgi:hypothetical protein